GSRDSTNSMASSSSTISVFDAHRFRKAHNEQLFDSYARRRKVIPEVGFNLEDDEYPKIMEQIALSGWRRLAAPRTDISKLLVQEFYANAAVSDDEATAQEELPYKSFVRGKEIDFSPNNIRRVMRFKRETSGALTDFKTRQALNQRLDEVLADLCISGASWKFSSSQPPVPIQLRRTELQPLARGWQEFIIHSLVPLQEKLPFAMLLKRTEIGVKKVPNKIGHAFEAIGTLFEGSRMRAWVLLCRHAFQCRL
ncbi:hypothetical protein PIB30_079085, partial [Stylosanthes scabra]|nr:hypothetical protein [Stylosanthes scabra]